MSAIPDPLFRALKDRLPDDFEAELVHPTRKDEVEFLIVSRNGEVVVVRFENASNE
jgi:hypothetical protein